ncbi:restriction endonuclease [Pseudomonas sp. JM0905a]|uniref:restriction endonuclease n=1 Tax=Pseudomonas sp. JM0905a TaxID=2772484 RepID=UPI001682F644|nr:restriction endonuclease [Pseudomonas sp. JM0905a]MBD2837111.1 restriction endonuclease [Pseudomonas sp. JM0905a]
MNEIDIYDISPKKFEELALSFLKEQGDLTAFGEIKPGNLNSRYDFSATLNDKDGKPRRVAIEAKHRRNLTIQDLHKIAETAALMKEDFDDFIFITSAKLAQDKQELLTGLVQKSGYSLVKIYQNVTFESLTRASNSQAVNEIIESKKSERTHFVYGSASIAAGLAGALISVITNLPYFQAEEKNIDSRIENVASALDSIKSLEKHLSEIRADMQKTQHESEIIKREYEKSQALKQLTDDQLTALRSAIGASSPAWWVKPLDYIFGFVLGIGASVVASIIYERFKRNKALNSPA